MRKVAKMLGVVAVAALALMAFVGTTGASAKVCSTSGVGAACASGHGNEYTTQSVKGSTGTSGIWTWTSGFARVECSSSLVAELTHGGSGAITALAIPPESCKSTLGSCTLYRATGLPWGNMTWVTTTAPNGTVEVNSTVGLEYTCGGVNCKYSAQGAGTRGEITVTGSEPAKVTATKVPMSKLAGSNALCSATADWDSAYTVEEPASLYLT